MQRTKTTACAFLKRVAKMDETTIAEKPIAIENAASRKIVSTPFI